MSPVAGMMRPNTSSSGSFNTKRSNPVNVSRLTRMLVPKPKKAFQSPGVQMATLFSLVMVLSSRKRGQDRARVGHPAKDPTLGFDHSQPHLMELGKVRTAAIARHDAAKAAIVGFAHGRVHTDLR